MITIIILIKITKQLKRWNRRERKKEKRRGGRKKQETKKERHKTLIARNRTRLLRKDCMKDTVITYTLRKTAIECDGRTIYHGQIESKVPGR